MLTRRHFLQTSLATTAALRFATTTQAQTTGAGPDLATFLKPPREWAPIPWWTWNGDMDLGEMERQLQEMVRAEVRGFYIFGLSGLKLEYLGEDWMERVRWAVKRGVELGLEPWIYDDFDWPTGLAKDRVIQRQELRQRAAFAEIKRVNGPGRVTVPVPEGKLIAAAAAPRRGAEVAVERTIDLTEQCGAQELVWDVPAGEWDVLVASERVVEGASFQHYHVDVFNPEATRYFIEVTKEAYKRALGPELFKHVRGWFADEPFFLNRYSGAPSETPLASAPWSPVLRAALKRPLAQTIVAIFGDADRAGRRIRRDFHETKMRLYLEHFWKPRAEWAARHGQIVTGHEGGQLGGGGDYAQTMGAIQWPGMDWLGIARAEYGLRMVEAKVVTSVARRQGKLAMQEGPGVFKWQQTLRDLRVSCDTFALYDFQSFTLNGYHYTVEGKRYYSPSAMFYQSPHWVMAPLLTRHSTRLVWALQQGRIPTRAAVLWSPETIWSDEAETTGQTPRGQQRTFRFEEKWMRGVEAAMSAVMQGQVEFSALDTAGLLEQATIAEGRLRVGALEYEIVVIPATRTLPLATLRKLADFHAAGGKLIALGALPEESESPANDAALLALVGELFGARQPECEWAAYRVRKQHAAPVRQTGERTWFIASGWERQREVPDALAQTLGPLCDRIAAPNWSIAGELSGKFFGTERALADGSAFLFLINSSDDPSQGELRLAQPVLLERWDTLSGQAEPWARQTSPTTAALGFLGRESVLLRIRPAEKWTAPQRRAREIVLPDRWRFGLVRGTSSFPTPRWETTQEIIHPETTMGFRYRVKFPVKEKPERLALLVDNADTRFHSRRVKCDYNCTINAEYASPLGWNQTFDRRMREFDLTGIVQVGENDLILEYQHCAWLGGPILPLLTLCGTFAVEDGKIIRATERDTAAVSWTELGYPYFSGAARYRQSFDWQPAAVGGRVRLRIAELREHARIFLNGQLAAELPWAPWEADITTFLRGGKNDLVIEVINTNTNFVEGQAAPSGLLGAVMLVAEEV